MGDKMEIEEEAVGEKNPARPSFKVQKQIANILQKIKMESG